ncbi:MAG TPA: hypothetical protein VMM79_14350 [Longimicrobiales bacterium]|nr:hypothetical protein [Longimicrobiales bacterium]
MTIVTNPEQVDPTESQRALAMVATGFACDKHFGRIPWPRIKFYVPGFFGDGRSGFYHIPERTVWLDAGLDDEMLVRTAFHEVGHHYEATKHWLSSEGFVYGEEAKLIKKWNAERAHQMAIARELADRWKMRTFNYDRERLRKQLDGPPAGERKSGKGRWKERNR